MGHLPQNKTAVSVDFLRQLLVSAPAATTTTYRLRLKGLRPPLPGAPPPSREVATFVTCVERNAGFAEEFACFIKMLQYL